MTENNWYSNKELFEMMEDLKGDMTDFGVFGKNPISQKSCSTLYSSSDLSTVINKVNEVINHLKDYGFFR